MDLKKIILDKINRCYCASHLVTDGELRIILASEDIDGPCCSYSGPGFEHREIIWDKPGGTMSFIQIPGLNGEFLATQRAYPGFNSGSAKVVWGKHTENGWDVKDFITLPYLHRFDVLVSEGSLFFIGATLCNSKRERDDWSDPGKIWAGEMPKERGGPIELKPIKDFLLKNHGYWRGAWEGSEAGFVTCDSGIYAVTPPRMGHDWGIRQILAGQISDMACYDLDNDGVDEIVTISPFHGNELEIRKKADGIRYDTVYRYPNPIELAHSLWAGEFHGLPTVIFGIRGLNGELGYIRYDKKTGGYIYGLIDKNVGTANVSVVHRPEGDILIAANHTKNEAAIYV